MSFWFVLFSSQLYLSVISPHNKFEFLCFCRSEVWRHFFQTSFLTNLSLFRYILLKHINYICFCFKFLCHAIWRESLKIHQVASNLNCFLFLSVFISFRIAICLFFCRLDDKQRCQSSPTSLCSVQFDQFKSEGLTLESRSSKNVPAVWPSFKSFAATTGMRRVRTSSLWGPRLAADPSGLQTKTREADLTAGGCK